MVGGLQSSKPENVKEQFKFFLKKLQVYCETAAIMYHEYSVIQTF